MKLRFLAVAGEGPALRQVRGRAMEAGLIEQLVTASLSVWADPSTPAISGSEPSAILIGWLYDRDSGERLTALPGGPDLGADIVERHWGVYALFTSDGPRHSALRDPSGSLPIYYASVGTASIYASDAELLRLALPAPLRPDLHFIRHWLSFPYLRGARTGADGVRELLPGTCRRVNGAKAELVTCWAPFNFVGRRSAIPDFEEAARLLRKEAVATIPRFAAARERLVVQLSGGLDSSIVAAALSIVGRKFSAVTFAT